MLQRLHPVQLRHSHVHDYQVVALPLDLLHRLKAVGGLLHKVTGGLPPQQLAQGETDVLFVVYNQYRWHSSFIREGTANPQAPIVLTPHTNPPS